MKKIWILLNFLLALTIVLGEGALMHRTSENTPAEPDLSAADPADTASYTDPAYEHFLEIRAASHGTGSASGRQDAAGESEISDEQEESSLHGNSAETGSGESEALPAAVMGSCGILNSMEQMIGKAGLSVEQVLNYDWLIENFYVVHPGTSMPEEILNPQTLLAEDLRIRGSAKEPQILIYHTHSQEAYVDSIPGDKSQTIVGVGDYLAEILTVEYGYNVIHHTGEYDVTNGQLDRDPAYSKALPALEQILEENPSIECVVDLHRDGVQENVHLVTDVNGQPTAQIMWFNGVGRDENGFLPGLENPWLVTNLAFSLQLRLTAMGNYPGLTRVNYLKSMRYNQHLRMSALIEVGAQTNTVSEAMNAMPPLADILNRVLSGDVQN